MGPILLIAIAAAAASALLAAGVAAGSVLAVPLFYLAPLPVMIAGIAFSPIAAGLAVVLAGAGLGLMFGGAFLLAYVLGIGAPAFALAYAAMLARPNEAQPDELVWYPVGHLVLLAAGFATLSVGVAVFSMAGDYETYRAAVTATFDAMLGPVTAGPDAEAGRAFLAHVLPPMAGLLTMVSQLICLYLAGRAARISDRMGRPWPQISMMRLPRMAPFVLGAALVVTMLPGLLGLVGSVAAATVMLAFSLVGFAVVHAITIGYGGRAMILAALWLTTVVLGWPVLAMAVLGFTDALFDFRARLAGRPLPPAKDR
ncbi:YybS family protein [Xanthobacter agilis]|uniref:DUF2232 domain-containing protein n=1 Tax=Xanthobacter agilis TaxID=47492 RepID=UPI003727A290